MSETIWTRDERATEIYRRVFGPALDHALIEFKEYDDRWDKLRAQQFARQHPGEPVPCFRRDEFSVDDDGNLQLGKEVLLVFQSGHKVYLWTSEYGGANAYDPENER